MSGMIDLAPWPDQRTRAINLAKTPGAIRLESDGERAVVASFGTPGAKHRVTHTEAAWLCDCTYYVATGSTCGHAVAAQYYGLTHNDATEEPMAKATGLNATQAQEVHLFDALLTDLANTLPEEEQRMGRPRTPDATLAWAAVKKAYTGFSVRRNQGYVHDAEQGGHIQRAPRWGAISDFLNRDDTADLLRGLVRLSASPLAGIEQDYAIDGTGFACGTYGSYKGTRYGGDTYREWVKLHACTGIHSNIVTDAVVLDGHSADSPQLPDLVQGTVAAGFKVREVSADKAYSGKANHWAIQEAGGTALIPFKTGKSNPALARSTNAPGLPGSGSLWKKAYHYFQAHEDEFYERYHKRSNVEATFSGIKRRFGERLKSRTQRARENEVLCKVIAWNICCVIRAMKESGIEANFTTVVRKVGGEPDLTD